MILSQLSVPAPGKLEKWPTLRPALTRLVRLSLLRLGIWFFFGVWILKFGVSAAVASPTRILAQLAPPTATELGHWLVPAAAVLWLVGQWKKVFPRKDEKFATKAELSALCDKIDARFLMLSEKIDALATRVSELATVVARLDERTKPNHVTTDAMAGPARAPR
jgi:outer membrane murein-binding lipoprotein Lpp